MRRLLIYQTKASPKITRKKIVDGKAIATVNLYDRFGSSGWLASACGVGCVGVKAGADVVVSLCFEVLEDLGSEVLKELSCVLSVFGGENIVCPPVIAIA